MATETLQASICIGCGLCCDGSIFDFTPITDADQLKPLLACGAKVTKQGEERSIGQRCACFTAGQCSIYADRPAICKAYRCRLLSQYEVGQISFSDAQAVIREAKSLATAVRSGIAQLAVQGAWSSIGRAWTVAQIDTLAKTEEWRRAHVQLLMDRGALQILVDRNFQARPTVAAARAAAEAYVGRDSPGEPMQLAPGISKQLPDGDSD